MSEIIEVVRIEIAKMTPQDGDTIVLKLSNYDNFLVSRIESMLKDLNSNYPNLKFMIMGVNDKIEIIKKELQDA